MDKTEAMEKTGLVSAGAASIKAFDDYKNYSEQGMKFPTGILLRTGEAVDYVALCYGSHVLPGHGNSSGGVPHEFPLQDNEHIVKITGIKCSYWNNKFLFSVKFHTDKNRVLGVDNVPQKGINPIPFEITFKEGYALSCLYGETAPAFETGKALERELLSGIGAYQGKIRLSLKDLDNRETMVMTLRGESPNDVFPVYGDNPFVNLYFGDEKNGIYRVRDGFNSIEIPAEENGEEYRVFGDYGAMYYVSKNISGNSYVGMIHYSGYLNLMFTPYMILPGDRTFFQMCNARISHFNLEDEEHIYHRLGYTEENIRKLFEDTGADIIASAPVSNVLTGGLSPLEAMKKIYSTMPEQYLHDIGNFVAEAAVSGQPYSKFFCKDDWEKFLTEKNMDFLFLGNIRIMKEKCFKDFACFVYQILNKVKKAYSSSIAGIPPGDSEDTIYDSIGDLLAAFYILTLVEKTKEEENFVLAFLLPTAAYVNTGTEMDAELGLKAFLNDVYHNHNGFYPVFIFKTRDGKKKTATLDSDIKKLMEEGFYFSELLGYYPESVAKNHGQVFEPEEILELACTYRTYNRGTLIPLFRLYHPAAKDSFLTFDLKEITSSKKLGYEYEGLLGYIVSPDVKDPEGLEPVYRAHNPGNVDHLFTKSKEEVASSGNLGYIPEHITGYECSLERAVKDGSCRYYKAEKRLVYRYYSEGFVDHRYTLSDEKTEREENYNLEGGSFYVAVLTPLD